MKQSLYKTCIKCAEEFVTTINSGLGNGKMMCPSCNTIGNYDYIIVGPEEVEKVQVKSCRTCKDKVGCIVKHALHKKTLGSRSDKTLECCLHRKR